MNRHQTPFTANGAGGVRPMTDVERSRWMCREYRTAMVIEAFYATGRKRKKLLKYKQRAATGK